MKRSKTVALATVGIGAAVLYFLFLSSPSAPDPKRLARRALSADSAQERVTAASELVSLPTAETTFLLRDVAKNANDPEVRSLALTSLASRNDGASLDTFLESLLDGDRKVRQAAIAAVRRIIAIPPDEPEFKVDDPQPARDEVAQRMRDKYRKREGILSATLAPTAVAAAPSARDPDSKKDKAETSVTAGAPAQTMAPSPFQPVAVPTSDYSAITLVSWMCRILALLIVVVEIVGTLSLILGERTGARPRKGAAGHVSPGQQHTETIQAPPGASLWSKISLLVGGAISIVVLLFVAEIIHLAVRMEQTAFRQEQATLRIELKIEASRIK